MSETIICRRPGADWRSTEKKAEDLLLAAFRCAGKKDRFQIIKAVLKAARKRKRRE